MEALHHGHQEVVQLAELLTVQGTLVAAIKHPACHGQDTHQGGLVDGAWPNFPMACHPTLHDRKQDSHMQMDCVCMSVHVRGGEVVWHMAALLLCRLISATTSTITW